VLPAGAAFCPACGVPVSAPVPGAGGGTVPGVAAGEPCRLCGAPLPAPEARCRACGFHQGRSLTRATLWRVLGGLAVIYAVTALLILLVSSD
jgi:hypothetical protein